MKLNLDSNVNKIRKYLEIFGMMFNEYMFVILRKKRKRPLSEKQKKNKKKKNTTICRICAKTFRTFQARNAHEGACKKRGILL